MSKNDSNTLHRWWDRLAAVLPTAYRRPELDVRCPRLCREPATWPAFVRNCPVAVPILEQLRLLNWERVPLTHRQWFNREPVPLPAYMGAFVVKLDQQLSTFAHLRRFLMAHPALIWGLGFPLHKLGRSPYGFDPQRSLPNHRHFNRMLRRLPNEILQQVLDEQVSWLQSRLPDSFGQTISLDTKHILAWVKENNPKAYMEEGRFDKTQQPAGDSDCKLGCKRRHHHRVTPSEEGRPAGALSVSLGEFYWGYASGAVVTKVPDWGEFVLAELTQTFDKGDVTYFFPLMQQTERRLGFRPRYGALDAGFDAFYVYDYFHSPDHAGFAAVAFSEKGHKPQRKFDPEGLPLCEAALAMPLKFTYQDRTTAIIPYQRAKHVCPLLYPTPNGQTCPINHAQWPQGGCTTHLAATPGSRLRHWLDRQGEAYKLVYKQRTAVERIFSQALALGIERPKLRNQQAIANHNTLIYLLINLRAMQRVGFRLETNI